MKGITTLMKLHMPGLIKMENKGQEHLRKNYVISHYPPSRMQNKDDASKLRKKALDEYEERKRQQELDEDWYGE